MNNELVSIIIPIYKVEQYLKQCLDSVLGQTYQNLEIILVDDGSPDNCGKICDEYALKDKRIKVIHKENGGLSSARNAGLDIATGEYISFIDSDDDISDRFIETLYQLCKEYNCDIAECDFLKFEKEHNKIPSRKEIKIISSKEKQLLLYSDECVNTIVVWNKLYKRYLYENLRFPNGKINEDEFTTYKVLFICKTNIVTTEEKLYYYRVNNQSIMGKKFNVKRLDVLEAWKERRNFYKNNKEDELYKKTVKNYQGLLKSYYILVYDNIEKPKKYLKIIKKELNNNLREYIQLSSISKYEKIKMILFVKIPRLYYILMRLKDRK